MDQKDYHPLANSKLVNHPFKNNMNIIAIVGARPQFIKHFPIEMCFKKHKYALKTIHTGQHYDENMSEIFFTRYEQARLHAKY